MEIVVDPDVHPGRQFRWNCEERKEPMIASGEAVLLGDVGATNARFAVLFDGIVGTIEWIEVAHHLTFDGAVKTFCNRMVAITASPMQC